MTVHDDLLRALRRAQTLDAKLSVLEGAPPVAGAEPNGLPAGVHERDVMFDDALKLLRIRSLHACGRRAEAEYYVCSIADADERARVRRCLGVQTACHPARVVMLVTVDCLRADRLSCNGCRRPTTPAIDRLAAEGINFPRAYSTAGQTAQSFPGILLSNFFQNFGRGRSVPRELTSLAEALSAAGFHTVGFNAANPHISHFYGYDRGFDEFSDFIGPQNLNAQDASFTDHSYRRASPLTEEEMASVAAECRAHPDVYRALKELSGQNDAALVKTIARRWRFYPYEAADLARCAIYSLMEDEDPRDRFYWLHLMDVHENITVSYSRLGALGMIEQTFLNACLDSPLGRQLLAAQPDKYRQLYETAVSYVDVQVQILCNFLRDAGLFGTSLLCLTADHGQELFENGVFGHGFDRLVERLVHVPLVFAGGLARGIAAHAAQREASSLDIAPTILDVCGVTPPASFLGTSLNADQARMVCGQTFYGAADNRRAGGGRSFHLDPFPAPVRECCGQMVYHIRDGWQLIHDVSRGSSELHRLSSADPNAPRPDAEEMRRAVIASLEGCYAPCEAAPAALKAEEEALVASRLQDLGYM